MPLPSWHRRGGCAEDRKSPRLNSSHSQISYAVFCLKKNTRAVAQAGPRAEVLLHRAADLDMEGWQNTSPVTQEVDAEIAGYVLMARRYDPRDSRSFTTRRSSD